jgi:hypothetical protein
LTWVKPDFYGKSNGCVEDRDIRQGRYGAWRAKEWGYRMDRGTISEALPMRIPIVITLLMVLGGCGSSETAVTAAAVASSEAKAAQASKGTEQRLLHQLGQANQAEQARLKAIDTAAQ